MAPKKRGHKYRIDSRKWPGVYGYDSQKKRIAGRPDTCYYIAYRTDGPLTWEKVGWRGEGITPQIASEIRATRLRTARHGETVKTAKEIQREQRAKDRILDEVKKAYFESNHGKKLKGRTTDLNRYEKHLQEVLGKRQISTLAPLDLDRVKTGMAGKAPGTVRNTIELLRRLIRFGVKNRLCPEPAFPIKVPRVDNERIEYLSPCEAGRLVAVLDEWPRQDVANMLRLALVTGMRRGEIFRLEDQDLDFKQDLIRLRHPKGGKTVSVPMSPPARQILENQLRWRNALCGKRGYSTSYVFPGQKGRLRTDCSAVERIKEKAELPGEFRIFHGLRHHFGVTLANSGEFSLDMIGELLTHKSPAMVRRYAQFLPGTIKKASERAAGLIQGQIATSKEANANKENYEGGKS